MATPNPQETGSSVEVRRWATVALLVLLACAGDGCRHRRTVTVLCAASLHRVLSEVAQAFQRQRPDVEVVLQPSGSLAAVRKITDLGGRADLIAVADAQLLERLMIPQHARWRIAFASNEIVLAHKDHSPFTEEIDARNWVQVLRHPSVRLGAVDRDLAPLGYHTAIVWELAERSGLYGKDAEALAARLRARVRQEHLAADETELWSLLEARAVDYAFLYRSTAEDHRLKTVSLPEAINLSRFELDDRYASVSVEVRGTRAGGRTRLRGHTISYGLAVPLSAANPQGGLELARFLLSPTGQRLLRSAGFRPRPASAAARVGPVPPMLLR